MNILYIAYSCSPNHGSEDRIGWKIPVTSARTNRVFVITKEEHRRVIEEYQSAHKDLNVTFYYVDIPGIYKKLYKGFAYAGRLNIWQKRAVALAEEICARENIDVIHQITPVEFRSIGDYGRIPNVKFVCGPVGGGEYIPKGLKQYACGHIVEEMLRSFVNSFSLFSLKKSGILNRCDAVLYANRETREYLSPVSGGSAISVCKTEIGIDDDELAQTPATGKAGEKCVFLVAGRLAYRKGHALLLDALSRLPGELDYECDIVGNGPQLRSLEKKCAKLGLRRRVVFKGRVPFDEMTAIYEKASVLVLPSIRETTGSVLLEAMAKGLPVVTANQFGGAVVVDQNAGWLYTGSTKDEYVENLAAVLRNCIESPEEVARKAENAITSAAQNTWDRKVRDYGRIYADLLH